MRLIQQARRQTRLRSNVDTCKFGEDDEDCQRYISKQEGLYRAKRRVVISSNKGLISKFELTITCEWWSKSCIELQYVQCVSRETGTITSTHTTKLLAKARRLCWAYSEVLPNGEIKQSFKRNEQCNWFSQRNNRALVTLRHQNSSPTQRQYAVEIRPKLWLTTKVTSGLHLKVFWLTSPIFLFYSQDCWGCNPEGLLHAILAYTLTAEFRSIFFCLGGR